MRLLVGFTNKGAGEFVVESMEASFRYPQDYSFFLQNVRLTWNSVCVCVCVCVCVFTCVLIDCAYLLVSCLSVLDTGFRDFSFTSWH